MIRIEKFVIKKQLEMMVEPDVSPDFMEISSAGGGKLLFRSMIFFCGITCFIKFYFKYCFKSFKKQNNETYLNKLLPLCKQIIRAETGKNSTIVLKMRISYCQAPFISHAQSISNVIKFNLIKQIKRQKNFLKPYFSDF